MYFINIFLYVNCILYVYMVFLLTYIQLMLNRWSAAWWFISWMLHPSYPFRDLQWGHSLEGKQTTLLLQEPQTARRGSFHLLMRVGLAYSIINNYLIVWHDLACWLVTGWQLGLFIIEPHWPAFSFDVPNWFWYTNHIFERHHCSDGFQMGKHIRHVPPKRWHLRSFGSQSQLDTKLKTEQIRRVASEFLRSVETRKGRSSENALNMGYTKNMQLW